jgi:hypothetical protein
MFNLLSDSFLPLLLLLLPFFTRAARAAAVHGVLENSANCSCCG